MKLIRINKIILNYINIKYLLINLENNIIFNILTFNIIVKISKFQLLKM